MQMMMMMMTLQINVYAKEFEKVRKLRNGGNTDRIN
jgi:hypothetical protein